MRPCFCWVSWAKGGEKNHEVPQQCFAEKCQSGLASGCPVICQKCSRAAKQSSHRDRQRICWPVVKSRTYLRKRRSRGWGCCSTTSICLSQASFNHSRPAQPSPTRSVLFVWTPEPAFGRTMVPWARHHDWMLFFFFFWRPFKSAHLRIFLLDADLFIEVCL